MNGLDKNHGVLLKKGKFDTEGGSKAADLRLIFDALGAANTPLVLHFHGGLVSKQAGIAMTKSLTPIYENAGTYPVFFLWESGWEEVLEQNLPAIFEEPIFKRILFRVAQFAKAKIDKGVGTGRPRAAGILPLTGESVVLNELSSLVEGHEPYADIDPEILPAGDGLTDQERMQFEEELTDDAVLEMLWAQLAGTVTPETAPAQSRGATIRGSTKTLMSPDVVVTTAPDGSRGFLSTAALIGRCSVALASVVKRFVERRDHGFYLTVVEEILRAFYAGNAGRFFWDGMKKSIIDSFGVAADCGGSQFLTELEAAWKRGIRPRITIVGHSAGAIYASQLLQEVQKRGLPADLHFNMILIAPACDFTLLAKTLQTAGSRIDGLRVFGMNDELERKDAILPVYPGSLLYFVSGVIEKQDDCPLAGMARYYAAPYDDAARFSEIDYVRRFALLQKDHALAWAPSADGNGYSCDMTSHGGWSRTTATVASVAYILAKGYGDGNGTSFDHS